MLSYVVQGSVWKVKLEYLLVFLWNIVICCTMYYMYFFLFRDCYSRAMNINYRQNTFKDTHNIPNSIYYVTRQHGQQRAKVNGRIVLYISIQYLCTYSIKLCRQSISPCFLNEWQECGHYFHMKHHMKILITWSTQ